jgi:hypothetical protein
MDQYSSSQRRWRQKRYRANSRSIESGNLKWFFLYADVTLSNSTKFIKGLANAPVCQPDQMVDIECRASQSKISHKKTGDNVDCNLKTGLECTPGGIKGRSVCHDYEIRILCDCSKFL